MELDDLKNNWEAVSSQINKQKNLNPEIIDQMTQTKYNAGLKKILYPEMMGIVICLAGIIFVFLNFGKLDTVVLQSTGIVTILLLMTISALSIYSIRPLMKIRDINRTYAETLKAFAAQRIRFHKLQQVNVLLSYLLLVATAILLSRIVSGKDISGSKYFWIFSITFGYIFLLFYSKWVMKHYSKTLKQAEELLKELAA